MDIERRWDMKQIQNMLIEHLLSLLPDAGEKYVPSLESIVEESMDRLHIFMPESTLSLACTLQDLPRYHAERMSAQGVSLLVVDSVSAFYWQDRCAAETHRNTERAVSANHLGYFLASLHKFRKIYGPITLLSNWGLSPVSKPSTAQETRQTQAQPNVSYFFRQHLHPFPAPFETPPRVLANANMNVPITHHITLRQHYLPHLSLDVKTVEMALIEDKQQQGHREIHGTLRTIENGMIANFTFQLKGSRK
jgi:DNA-repair protein XRCC2